MNNNHVLSKLGVLIFFISFFSIHTMSAQWGGKLIDRGLDKVKHQAEKRVNRGVNKGIDKSLDKAEEGAVDVVTGKKKDDLEKSGDDSDFLAETEEDINEPFNSDFVGMFEVEMEMTNKEGTKEMSVDYFFNKNVVCMDYTMDNSNSKIIMDHDNNRMTVVDKVKKSAVVMPQTHIKNAATSETYEVVREGSTRFIVGRKCVKYLITSEDSKTTAWVDESVRFDYSKVMKSFGGKYTDKSGGDFMEQISGFPIEMETVTNKGKDKILMRTISFEEGNVDMNAFNLEAYNVTDMSTFGQ